ncbi:hypothetical protein Tco_0344433 [Tanacetum coccineum]
MEYERRVKKDKSQTTEEKTDTSNVGLDPLDASSVIIESNGTESKEQIQAADQGMMHMPRSSMFKRCLIAADQASVFMDMTSVHISSGIVLHQMTSDHNRSELGIQDHSNEQQVHS